MLFAHVLGYVLCLVYLFIKAGLDERRSRQRIPLLEHLLMFMAAKRRRVSTLGLRARYGWLVVGGPV